MNVLIIGNGGREHALAWKVRQSALCDKLYIAPGNGGTGEIGENIPLGPLDFEGLCTFALKHDVELMVVGPEAPLVAGIRDYVENDSRFQSILVLGPGKSGARLEGSKDFSKQFMLRHHIPTAKARTFTAEQLNEAIEYLHKAQPPIVLKADGLAAGKGVVICPNAAEGEAALREMLVEKKFGDAGSRILVEEFLDGIELSVFVLIDSNRYVLLPEAKDYKRIGEGDTGPNTGGMGAVSPVYFANLPFMQKVISKVIEPTIAGLRKEGIPYRGFLFIGLMNVKGEPYVVEYNVRMGDPETQAVMPRIKSDLLPFLVDCAIGKIKNQPLDVDPRIAVTAVLASEGYPGSYARGRTISGLGQGSETITFHAGTTTNESEVTTNGGRVLAVTAVDDTLEGARNKAYERISRIRWDGLYYRKDIGMDLIKKK